ncbi:hypothetical protein [Streptomyces sp. NPDC005408]|uniref:hypothetical protein n=1 Tax=Streptomyces sp. NPDC005408 TaxID=3155341 RepID=UPI0033A22FC3
MAEAFGHFQYPTPPLARPGGAQAVFHHEWKTAPNNINNTRLRLKRLTERGILVETEQGLFTQPRP